MNTSHLPANEDGTECSETSAYKIQTPGNYQEESTQNTIYKFVCHVTLRIQIPDILFAGSFIFTRS